MGKLIRHFTGKYDLYTIYLVPGLTLLLASADNWFRTNLSLVGNRLGRQGLLAIWGLSVGIYYSRYLFYLFRLAAYRKPAAKWLVLCAAVCLCSSVVIPYEPGQRPGWALLHVGLAFVSPFFLALAMGIFLKYLSSRNRRRYRKAWGFMWVLAGTGILLLFWSGFITSFLEIYLVIGVCWYLRYMEELLCLRY